MSAFLPWWKAPEDSSIREEQIERRFCPRAASGGRRYVAEGIIAQISLPGMAPAIPSKKKQIVRGGLDGEIVPSYEHVRNAFRRILQLLEKT